MFQCSPCFKMCHSMFAIYLFTCHVFLHSVCSVCFIRPYIFQVIRKKKKEFIGFSFNSYNFAILTILETSAFHTEIYKFRIFIRSLCCFYFSSCLRREDQCVVVVFFFSHEEHEDMPLSWKMILFWIFRCFRSEIW